VAGPAERQLVPLPRRDSLAREVLGDSLASLRGGAVWILSDVRRDASFVEEQWLSERLQALAIGDVTVVILAAKAGQVDYCEFQFHQPIARHHRAQLAEMAPALTRAWDSRLPGTVERLIARRRPHDGAASRRLGDLLDASNPAGLSRSEYRICALVREGLLARAIAEQLVVCESTVRSHLRSIYAKTGAAGHVDLLHRLTRPAEPAEDIYLDASGLSRLAG